MCQVCSSSEFMGPKGYEVAKVVSLRSYDNLFVVRSHSSEVGFFDAATMACRSIIGINL